MSPAIPNYGQGGEVPFFPSYHHQVPWRGLERVGRSQWLLHYPRGCGKCYLDYYMQLPLRFCASVPLQYFMTLYGFLEISHHLVGHTLISGSNSLSNSESQLLGNV